MKNTASDGTGMSRLESSFSFKPKNRRKSDNHLREDDRSIEPGNLPRVSKLMALAIRFDGLVRRGEVRDYADLARLGYVTRAHHSDHEPAQPGPGHPRGDSLPAPDGQGA